MSEIRGYVVVRLPPKNRGSDAEREIQVRYSLPVDGDGEPLGIAIEQLEEVVYHDVEPPDSSRLVRRRLSDFSEREVAKIADDAGARVREELER